MELQSLCTDDCINDVIEKYQDMIYRLAITHVKSKYDADDIFQEVYLRYFSKNRIFESEEHRKAWLIRVTINCSKKFWSSSWMKKTCPLEETITFDMPEENDLHDRLLELPSKLHIPLHLFYFENLSVEQISKILKMKPPAVRMRLLRGRNMLKEKLKGDYFYEE